MYWVVFNTFLHKNFLTGPRNYHSTVKRLTSLGCTQPSRVGFFFFFNSSKRHLQEGLQPQKPKVHHTTWASTEWRQAESGAKLLVSCCCWERLDWLLLTWFKTSYKHNHEACQLAPSSGGFQGSRYVVLPFPPFGSVNPVQITVPERPPLPRVLLYVMLPLSRKHRDEMQAKELKA